MRTLSRLPSLSRAALLGLALLAAFEARPAQAQLPFSFNINSSGRRVALVEARAETSPPRIVLRLLDSPFNATQPYVIRRRPYGGSGADWVQVGTAAPSDTVWTDSNVALGDRWEYQLRRQTGAGDAIGYVAAGVDADRTGPAGRVILLVDETVAGPLAPEIARLTGDLVAEGWTVDLRTGPRGAGWVADARVPQTKAIIQQAYDEAPADDKPTHLFLLGHLPVPRAGLGAVAPDDHDENKGARGADTYYADLDGVFTDVETYDAPGIDPLAVNLPGDGKWDQDFIPSSLELAFGRVDFADLIRGGADEITLLRRYLDRLHAYRTVAPGWDMGRRSAFRYGYDNSNDGSLRSLPALSGAARVALYGGPLSYPAWVQANGPFQVFMQNSEVPDLDAWRTIGMNATVFSSDQSYWGFWDRDESGSYGLIRSLLAQDTRVLVMLYTTTAVNLFHQVGLGETVGEAARRIMDHSAANNLYEKPSQAWDEPQFWNRTHFQVHGDPTLRLNQVAPPVITDASVSDALVGTVSWEPSPSPSVVGYHIYVSRGDSTGPFVRYRTAPGDATELEIGLDYPPGIYTPSWIMVRAVAREASGSGTYLNPSLGDISAITYYAASAEGPESHARLRIGPNPASGSAMLRLDGLAGTAAVTVHDALGRRVLRLDEVPAVGPTRLDVSALAPGVYVVRAVAGEAVLTARLVVH